MQENITSQPFSFDGEIIEIFEKSGKKFAKILFKCVPIEVSMERILDAHLGDKVTVNAKLLIKKVSDKIT